MNLLLIALMFPVVLGEHMYPLYSWKVPDLEFSSEAKREAYLTSGQFIPKNNFMIDVDFYEYGHKRKIFVTMPKLRPGVPVTLATVTDRQRDGVTLLRPYPDWSWHQGHCDGITSVFRVKVDECGRLWVLDCGRIDVFGTNQQVCPPQILVFDLKTDKLIRRHRFSKSILDKKDLLITIAVDSRTSECSDSMAYIADVEGCNLLVYDSKRDVSWTIKNRYFYPYPEYGHFDINGVTFELMDGVLGLALGPVCGGDRILYFHSLASVHESWVSTSIVRNHSLFIDDAGASPQSFHNFEHTRTSQAGAQDMTRSGILLYGMVQEHSVGCWNSKLPFEKHNFDVVYKNHFTPPFQSGMKVIGNYIYILSIHFQDYFHNNVDEEKVNIVINVGKVDELLKGTKCDPNRHQRRA